MIRPLYVRYMTVEESRFKDPKEPGRARRERVASALPGRTTPHRGDDDASPRPPPRVRRPPSPVVRSRGIRAVLLAARRRALILCRRRRSRRRATDGRVDDAMMMNDARALPFVGSFGLTDFQSIHQ